MMPKFLNKSTSDPGHECCVKLLDDAEELKCEFQTNHKGKFLLDHVCDKLNLAERDYFGLFFIDSEEQQRWLDPVKAILKQTKEINPIEFSFRVKFYPPSPFALKEQITRYQIYLQLKEDLRYGRLYCSSEVAALLAAHILQAELGDYNSEEHAGNYATEFKFIPDQSQSFEEEVMEIHQTELKGQSTDEAEANFLKKACALDSYGIDPHSVKDQKGNQVDLGINFSGIIAFQNNRKTGHHRWNEVQKINYEGKMFIVHLVLAEDSRNKKKETVGFKCATAAACKYVWRSAVEQMLFFTSQSSSNIPRTVSGGGFFSGSKFRYSGRVEKEVLEEMAQLSRQEPQITRVGSIRRRSASFPATPTTPTGNEFINFEDGNTPSALEPLGEDSEALQKHNQETTIHIQPVGDNVGMGNSRQSSRCQTPIPKGNNHFSSNVASDYRFSAPNYNHFNRLGKRSFCSRVGSFLRACLPSLIFTSISLLVVMVVAFETDVEFFALVRRAPEMVMIRREYYEPMKQQIMLLGEYFKNLKN